MHRLSAWGRWTDCNVSHIIAMAFGSARSSLRRALCFLDRGILDGHNR